MASEKLQVILELVTGQYKREATEAATATGKIGSAASGATGGLGRLSGGFNLLKGAMVGLGITRVASELRDMAQAAADDAEAQEILAGALRTNVGATDDMIVANERWISSMQIATRTADNDLRQAITDLTVAGRDLEEAQSDVGIAIDIAASKGLELGSVMKGLVRAQATGSVGGLGRLGIETKNAAGELLTYDEILQNAAKTMGGTAARAAGTLAGALERGKIALAEAREETGANVLPAVVALTDAWNELAVGILGGNTQLSGLQSIFNSIVASGIDPFEDAVFSAGGILAEFAAQFSEPMDTQTFETLVMMLGLTNDEVLELRRNFIQNGDAVVGNEDKLKSIIGVLDGYVGVADPAVLLTRRFQEAQADAAGSTRDHTGALQAQRDLLRELTDPLFAVVGANERLEDAQRRLNDLTIDGNTHSTEYRDALGDVLIAQMDLTQAQADAAEVGSEGLDLLEQYAIAAGINTEAFDLWRASVDLLAGSISKLPANVGGVNTVTGSPNRPGQFAEGGVVPGRRGSPQLILAHGGETVLPTHQSGFQMPGISRSVNINVNSPTTQNLAQDLQLATILATVTTMVEVQN